MPVFILGKKDNKYYETLRKVLCYQEFLVELIPSCTQPLLFNLNLKQISCFQVKILGGLLTLSYSPKATYTVVLTGAEKLAVPVRLSSHFIQSTAETFLTPSKMITLQTYVNFLKCSVHVAFFSCMTDMLLTHLSMEHSFTEMQRRNFYRFSFKENSKVKH